MSGSLRDGEWLDDNRANWDERVPLHVASTFYDRSSLRAGASGLDPIAEAGIRRMFPDGLVGVRVLHLQCHFGSDSLSLAHLGAEVVGIDFSEPAIDEARRMATELGYDRFRARFVEANVYDARHMLPEPASFDLVFVTWGTITWLPDLHEWARIVTWFLKPGGRLYFADGHPAAWPFDGDNGPNGLPGITYPYAASEPDVLDDPTDYADPHARLVHTRTWEWAHPLSEIHGALVAAGLSIDRLDEHYRVPWRAFPALSELGDGMWGWPDERWVPLALELDVTLPSN